MKRLNYKQKFEISKKLANQTYLAADIQLLEKLVPKHNFMFRAAKDFDVLHKLLDFATESQILANRKKWDKKNSSAPGDQDPQGGDENPNPQGGADDPNPQGGDENPNPQGGAEDPNPQGGDENSSAPGDQDPLKALTGNTQEPPKV